MERASAALAESRHDVALANDELGARLAGLKGLMDPPRFAVGDVVRTKKSKVARYSFFMWLRYVFLLPSLYLSFSLSLPLSSSLSGDEGVELLTQVQSLSG